MIIKSITEDTYKSKLSYGKQHLIDAHTKGKYFQKRKEKKEKKRKEKAFLSGGFASGASLFWKIPPEGMEIFQKTLGLGLAAEKRINPILLSSFI